MDPCGPQAPPKFPGNSPRPRRGSGAGARGTCERRIAESEDGCEAGSRSRSASPGPRGCASGLRHKRRWSSGRAPVGPARRSRARALAPARLSVEGVFFAPLGAAHPGWTPTLTSEQASVPPGAALSATGTCALPWTAAHLRRERPRRDRGGGALQGRQPAQGGASRDCARGLSARLYFTRFCQTRPRQVARTAPPSLALPARLQVSRLSLAVFTTVVGHLQPPIGPQTRCRVRRYARGVGPGRG